MTIKLLTKKNHVVHSKTSYSKGISDKKTRKVWGSGPLKIHDTELDCYILEDGTPVLNKGKMMITLGRAGEVVRVT